MEQCYRTKATFYIHYASYKILGRCDGKIFDVEDHYDRTS